MATHVLELNDFEVRIGAGAKILARSPGYAVLLDDKLRLGAEALKLAHLHPRQTWNRFWTALSEDALAVPAGRFRNHADLAYAHLKAVHEQAGKPAELILAVPGSSSSTQLSLLLGIVQALPFKAVGLVDTAVAAAASATGPGSWQHLDVGLHRAVVTRIGVDGGVKRESVEALDNVGACAVHDAAAALIADLFVEQCRFDPMHHAETEQALYDQVPGCLRRIASQAEVQLEIRYRGARNEVQLARGPLLERLNPIYRNILNKLEPGRATLIGDRAATLPGLADLIPDAFIVPEDAVLRGCEEHGAALLSAGPHLNYVTHLPLPAKPSVQFRPPAATLQAAASGPAPAPTHLLLGYRLFPLRAAPIHLSARGGVHAARLDSTSCAVAVNGRHAMLTPMSDVRMYVNGEPVSGARTLHAGDKLSFAGSDTVYSLVTMAGPDAA